MPEKRSGHDRIRRLDLAHAGECCGGGRVVPVALRAAAGARLRLLCRRGGTIGTAGIRGEARTAALRLDIFFVFGFSTVFIALGASATALGQLLLAYRYETN